MTIGISKEDLEELFDDFIVNDMLLDDFRSLVISECEELNPWLPIENAPKDEREILLFVPGCHGCEIGRWNINADSWSCYPYEPTHYQELPEYPV